jgi:hypothetical protein
MKTKASIVVMSHMSDAQELLGAQDTALSSEYCRLHLNFAKFVILQCKGNLNKEIDADKMYEVFTKYRESHGHITLPKEQ